MTTRSRGAIRDGALAVARHHATHGLIMATLCVVPGITPANAQGTGQPLAPPVVHELRLTIPALSRATLSSPIHAGGNVWTSTLSAVTNVAIDVLLLPPDNPGAEARALHIKDADGVDRRLTDGPILVARALTPGRHNLSIQWQGPGMSTVGMANAAGGLRTFTRPALPGAPADTRATTLPATTTSPEQVLLRIAP